LSAIRAVGIFSKAI
jgi:hypothetical protein